MNAPAPVTVPEKIRSPTASGGFCWLVSGGGFFSVVMVSDTVDIAESLRILLSTYPGERVMLPTYGCGLRRMVFEDVTADDWYVGAARVSELQKAAAGKSKT